MQDYSSKMAIIGAGPVGLAVAKALRDHRIAYDQFEADSDIGGNWLHGVYRNVHIISSRKTTEYADYPMPADYPDFPGHDQMLAYLRDYTEHFGLRPNIRFNAKVLMARPLADGRWELELAGGEKLLYKGVIVCNGHHWSRRFPTYPGKFSGEYIHSKDYHEPQQLAGKRVLVIGGGNSACDIASEAARVAACSRISLLHGYWFIPKTFFGVPAVDLLHPMFPVWAQRLFMHVLLRIVVGKYSDYGFPEPKSRIYDAHPTLNSELLHYAKHGRIQARPEVARFEGQTVHFVDGRAEDYDIVVCATGFYLSFPFLPPGLVPVKGSAAQVYAGALLADCKNIYVPATEQVRYGFGPWLTPLADLLARFILLQDEMELPLGLVLKESGEKLPRTHLVDPLAFIREIKRLGRKIPALRRLEARLRKHRAAPPPPVLSPVSPMSPDAEVY